MSLNSPTTRTAGQVRRGARSRRRSDLLLLGVLGALGIWGFSDVYADIRPVLSGLFAIAFGTFVGALAASQRWDILRTAAVALPTYFVLGILVLGFDWDVTSIIDLGRGPILGWTDLLTLNAPVDAPDYVAVVPYVTGWVVGLANASIVGRVFARDGALPMALIALLALLAPLATLLAATLLGTSQPVQPVARGLLFSLIAVLWLAWRVPEPATDERRDAHRRGGLGAVAVVAIAATVAGGVALGAVAAEPDRLVLREEIQPPFEPRDYPSPLAAFRAYMKEDPATVVFTVTGAQSRDLLRLAVMDSYDGRLWNVGDPTAAAEDSGVFELVSGRRLDAVTLADLGPEVEVTIEVVDYEGVWLPAIGYPSSITFIENAPASTDLRYNAGSGSLAVTTQIGPGTVYHLETRRQFEDRDALAGVPVADVSLPTLADVPDIVASRAIEFAGSAESPIDRLTALELALSTTGFLSHGLASDSAPSSAGHGADRMIALLGRAEMVGDAEQYASAFALMARSFGYPARVVMGFAPTVPEDGGEVAVTADQVTAWAEVAFRDVGWVPFFPTATNTDVPREEAPKPRTQPEPQVRQPPRQTDGRDEVIPAIQPEDPEPPCEPLWWCGLVDTAIRVGVVAIALGALYVVPILLIGAAKRRRRIRRLDHPQIDRRAAGAWDEVIDTYGELGYRIPRNALRGEIAVSLLAQIEAQLSVRERERRNAADRRRRQLARREAARKRTERLSAAEVLRVALETAHDARTWRPGVVEETALPETPKLVRLARDTDRAVFRGGSIPVKEIEALWTAGNGAGKDAAGTVSWFRRRLAAFRYHVRRDLLGQAASRLELALDRARRPALTNGAVR